MMKTITYIFHSCYMIEFDGFSVLFDYYRDAQREDGSCWVKDYLLNKEEDLYVLCSHSHSDHFNPEILNWKQRKRISPIFRMNCFRVEQQVQVCIFWPKKRCLLIIGLKLKRLALPMLEVLLITYNNRQYFHAGDLNNWHWNEEVDKSESLVYENNYLCELELLAEKTDRLQIAMFPLDPRLGKDFMRGAEQFVSRINTAYLFPMHFGEQYEEVNRFGEIAKQYGCNYMPVTQLGQMFTLE